MNSEDTFNNEEVFIKFKKGDTQAFELIYKKYFSRMYSLSKKVVGDSYIAEDITQQIFLILWEKHDSIAIEGNLVGYLARSVYNLSLQHLRKNNIHTRHHGKIYDEFLSNSKGYFESQLMFIEDDENISLLRKSIQNLPSQCREILELSKFKEKDNKEIAQYLGISTRTVENQLYIGLKKLRQIMKS